jgi:hypothetical protein
LWFGENDAGELRTTVRPLSFAPALPAALRSFALADSDYDLLRDDLLLAAGAGVYLVEDAFAPGAIAVPIDAPSRIDVTSDDIDELLASDFDGDGLIDAFAVAGATVRLLASLPANP